MAPVDAYRQGGSEGRGGQGRHAGPSTEFLDEREGEQRRDTDRGKGAEQDAAGRGCPFATSECMPNRKDVPERRSDSHRGNPGPRGR